MATRIALLSLAVLSLAGCSCEVEPEHRAPELPPPAACTSDADCRLFWSGSCGCACIPVGASAPDPACAGEGAAGCVSDPCDGARALCDPIRRRCFVSRAPAGALHGPCASDADCQVRLDSCDCTCDPVLGSSPPAPDRCPGGGYERNCGTESPCSPYSARCDTATRECTLAASER